MDNRSCNDITDFRHFDEVFGKKLIHRGWRCGCFCYVIGCVHTPILGLLGELVPWLAVNDYWDNLPESLRFVCESLWAGWLL